MRSADIQRIAAMLSAEHKVRIVASDRWQSDIRAGVVYYNQVDVFKLPDDHVLGLLLHEIGHIKYSSELKDGDLGQNKELRREIMNMLEDIRIEERISRAYRNSREIMDLTRSESQDVLVRILSQLPNSIHEKALLYASVRFYGRGFANPVEQYETIGEAVKKIMDTYRSVILESTRTIELMPVAEEIEKLLISQAGQMSPQEKQQLQMKQMQQQGNPYSGHSKGRAQSMDPVKEAIIREIAKKEGSAASKLIQHFNNTNLAPVIEIIEQSTVVGKRLDGILKRNNAREYSGRYKTGKLVPKRLFRVRAMKDRRPFARTVVKSNKSYAFAIMADVSGSMFNHNNPFKNAASIATSSMLMTSEALRMSRIPRGIYVFGTSLKNVGKFGTGMHDFDTIDRDRHYAGGGTNIAHSLNEMIKDLKDQDVERKIAVVFTDGQDDPERLRDVVKRAQKNDIEVIMIFYGGGFTDEYPNPVLEAEVLPKSHVYQIEQGEEKEIPGVFTDILRKNIKVSS